MTAGTDGRILAARAAAWEGNRASLDEHLRVMDAAGEFGRSIEANRQSLRAAQWALDGRVDEAAAEFRLARRAFSDLDLSWLEGLSAMDAAFTLPANHPEAVEARGAARRIFEELGATAMLTQLDALPPEASAEAAASRQPTDSAVVASETA